LVAFALAVLAFASTYAALDRLTPIGLGLFNGGYPACISLSFGVITTLYVPNELLYPLSAYSVAVFVEVALSYYLLTVTIWAFAGAQRNTETMIDDLKAMWDRAVQRNVEQLQELDPTGGWRQNVQKAKDDWLKRLR
jgi:hypothetical protein